MRIEMNKNSDKETVITTADVLELLEYLDIDEKDISMYKNVTGSYAVISIGDKYLLGYNNWRQQWELPAGGIEVGETPREAAARELFEETHQKNSDLINWLCR